jgi:hypothetical protein
MCKHCFILVNANIYQIYVYMMCIYICIYAHMNVLRVYMDIYIYLHTIVQTIIEHGL